MDIITPLANEAGMVYYGQNGLHVQSSYGVCAADFLQMHADLADRGLEVRRTDVGVQVDFVFYCHSLAASGADVGTLIREVNAAQKGDGTDLMHALSLAKVFYHYSAAGCDVHIRGTHKSVSRADLVIDHVDCELKVRLDQTGRRLERHRHLLFAGRVDECHGIYSSEIRSLHEDLSSALFRVDEGFRQASCVILDLSSHFHSWNYHRLRSFQQAGDIRGLSTLPVPPVAGTCILFSPDNALDRNDARFNPRAYWGYLPLDGGLAQGEG